jgi:hypothetical protein
MIKYICKLEYHSKVTLTMQNSVYLATFTCKFYRDFLSHLPVKWTQHPIEETALKCNNIYIDWRSHLLCETMPYYYPHIVTFYFSSPVKVYTKN